MLQFIRLGLGIMPLLLGLSSVSLAQTASPPTTSPASASTQPINRDSLPNLPREEAPSQSVSQREVPTTPPSCPAGQFASKFPDVPPDVWAYEAVNRLAIGEFRCFPFSLQR